MKRKGLLFFSLISLVTSLFLTSCDNQKKVPLLFGYLNGHIENLTYEQLQEKNNHRDNFLLFVTPKSNCTCWTAFLNNVLTPYIKEHHLEVFTINYTDFFTTSDESLDTFSLTLNPGHQTLGLFKEGVLKLNREYDSKSRLWYEYNTFSQYILEYIYYPTMFQINIFNDLDKLLLDKEKVSLLFYDLDESESRFLFDFYLKNYAYELTKDKVLYLVNTRVKNIKLDDELTEDELIWQNFINEYSLNTYLDGVLPLFQHYTLEDYLVEQSVYLNDVISTSLVDEYYKIENSYFTNERVEDLAFLNNYKDEKVLVNKLVKESDTFIENNIRKWDFTLAARYHDLYVNAFLDYYL